MGQTYRRMEDQKPGIGCCVARTLLKGKDLKQKLKCVSKNV